MEHPGDRLGARVRARADALRRRSAARRARCARLPGGRLSSRLDRLGVAAAYAGAVLVLGLFPALVFDPAARSCSSVRRICCSSSDSPRLYDGLNRVGVYAGLAWSLALIALLALRLGRSTPALRRLVWPALDRGRRLSRARRLGLRGTASTAARSATVRPPATSGSPRRRRLSRLLSAWSGVGCASAVRRSAIARLVVEVAASPGPAAFAGCWREMLTTRRSSSPIR